MDCPKRIFDFTFALRFALAMGSLLAMGMVFAGANSLAFAQSPDSLPAANSQRHVIDEARIIQGFAVEQLEELCREVAQFKNSELVILTVNDTGRLAPRVFATRYFNRIGIGSTHSNNGILIFAAMKQRRAEIILGDGLTNDRNNRLCEKIAREYMVARFKRNDPGGAMYGGGFEVARQVLGMTDIADRLERETNEQRRLRKSSTQDRRWIFAVLAAGGCLVIGGGAFLWSRHQVRYGARNCKDCSAEMILLDEQEDDEYLDPPEVIEEQIGSVDYDVWACIGCENVLRYRYGRFWTRYSHCPDCGYKTRSKVETTIRAATQKRGGKVRVRESCANCSYSKTYVYSTPRLPKPSRSSSSGGSSSGGGWSGSFGGGGGGFSGGSSSGGGGGASW